MILLLYAMLEEASATINHFQLKEVKSTTQFQVYQNEKITIIISGIGKANAASSTTYGIINYKPRVVINLGFVGACGFKCFDILVIGKAQYHDFDLTIFDYQMGQVPGEPPYFESSPLLLNIFNQYPQTTLYTGDKFVDRQTISNTQYVVDMEGAAIFQTCKKFGIPVISIKIVSDVLATSNQIQDYIKFESIHGSLELRDVIIDYLEKEFI